MTTSVRLHRRTCAFERQDVGIYDTYRASRAMLRRSARDQGCVDVSVRDDDAVDAHEHHGGELLLAVRDRLAHR